MVDIVLAGPGKNALNRASMGRLLADLDAAAGRPVLLTGEGDTFCAGLDLREVASLDDAGTLDFLELVERCFTALYLYPGPTVALVQGHAIAGGCILTIACDRRIAVASPRAKIGLNEVALGVCFPPRTMAIVKQRVPRSSWTDVVLAASLVSPDEALRLGLVDAVVDPAEARARADADLARLAASPAAAYATAKRLLRGTADDLCPAEDHRRRLDEALAAWTAPEIKARLLAVLDKKK